MGFLWKQLNTVFYAVFFWIYIIYKAQRIIGRIKSDKGVRDKSVS